MKQIILYIRQRLSIRLGMLIVVVVTLFFIMLLNFLFYRCKLYIQHAAIDHATQLLDNTAERINGIMNETELVTNYMAVTTTRHLHPDSLLAFTRRTVAENYFLTGFAISMEPYFFPSMGRYFSAYSLRHRGLPASNTTLDSITTVREGPFEYFDALWYKTPHTLGTPCWVDAYDDYNEGTLSSPDILTSYCCPMRDADGRYVGSVTASLTLKWLSGAFASLKPYPNSSAIMLGRDGTYLVHPDTTKLFRQNIFSDAAPKAQRDINILGKSMLGGRSGMMRTVVDGQYAYIFYRPLERTGWSLAIVCPESDVFARYNRLLVMAWIIVAVGLMLLMFFCYQTVCHAVQPLRQLDERAKRIADGLFDEPLAPSTRCDSIGRLTNSFIRMQQSLAASVTAVRRCNDDLQQQNDDLARAYQLKLETNRRRSAFVQDMYHEIRTPLNVISGFTQVLSAGLHELPDDDVADFTARMKQSAADIKKLVHGIANTPFQS